MGRMIAWGAVLLGAAAALWFLFMDDRVPGPGVGVLGEGPASPAGHATGPELKARGGAPLVVEDTEHGRAHVDGVVVDEDGRPVAGVRVSATPQTSGTRPGHAQPAVRPTLRVFEAPHALAAQPAARATTGADGHFRLEKLVERQSYLVRAEPQEPRYGTSQSVIPTAQRPSNVRLVVGTGSSLRVRVVDADGHGIAAWVSARVAAVDAHKPWLRASWSLTSRPTAADGRLRIAAVPGGTVLFDVLVVRRGERSGLRVETPTQDEVELPFEAPGGATVTGTVADSAGHPIPGARLQLRSGPVAGAIGEGTTTKAATTGADGRFAAHHLIPGTLWSVEVVAEGFVPSGTLARNTPLLAERPLDLHLTLLRGVTLEGRVLDEQGTPVPGAEAVAVRMGRDAGRWYPTLATAEAGSDGAFRLTGVAPGEGLLQAQAEGWVLAEAKDDDAARLPWMNVSVRGTHYDAPHEGQVLKGLEIHMLRGASLHGRVVDKAQAGVAGATVTASRQSRTWSPGVPSGGSSTAVSGEDGGFTLTGLQPGGSWKLWAHTDTQRSDPLDARLGTPDAPAPEPTLVLQDGAVIVGRVVEADTGGAAGVTVTCSSAQASVVTDAEGNFRFEGLRAGSCTLRALGGTDGGGSSASKGVTLAWGQTLAGVRLELPATFPIAGHVEDEAGKPCPGISVTAQVESKSRNRRRRRSGYRATTDAKGAFEIVGLPEGTYSVYAGSTREHGVSAGTTDVRLVWKAPTERLVEGTVVDADGRPVARGSVQIYVGPRGKRRNSTSAAVTGGYFSLRLRTSESSVDVRVTEAVGPDGQPLNFVSKRESDLDLDAGPLRIVLEKGLRVAGHVRDDQGHGIRGVIVALSKPGNPSIPYWYGGRQRMLARTAEDGSFAIDGLADAEYDLRATPGGAWATPDKQTVQAGDEAVVVTLSQGASVEGRVLDPDGRPVSGAYVYLSETAASRKARGASSNSGGWVAQQRLRSRAEADGTFRVRGLPERAVYQVQASAPSLVPDIVKDVPAGTRDVVLHLHDGATIEGDVVGPDGEGITGGWVQASPVDTKAGLPSSQTQIQAGGHFKLGPVRPARYRLSLRLQGTAWSAPPPVEVDAPATGVHLVAREAVTIRGRLLGTKLEGFRVVFRAGTTSRSASTAADGSFAIPRVPAQVGTLTAHRPGDDRYARLEGAEPGRGPYNLSLQVGQSIEGRIEGWDGTGRRPNVYCLVDSQWVHGTVAADGTWRVTGLGPGRYRIMAWVPGGRIEPLEGVAAGSRGIVLTFKTK
jgi:protocatechuate 3,4-dioxygenase beta subunit